MKIHVVKKGDTLYQLAQKYHVDLDKLIELNPQIADPNQIDIGMKVKIPSAPIVVAPPPNNMQKHVVQQGDTLWKLSKAAGVSLEAMIAANPHLKNPSVLMTGEIVYIPNAAITQQSIPSSVVQVMSPPGKVSTAPILHEAVMPQAPEVEFYKSEMMEEQINVAHYEELQGPIINQQIPFNPMDFPQAGIPMKTEAIKEITEYQPMTFTSPILTENMEPVQEPFAQFNVPATTVAAEVYEGMEMNYPPYIPMSPGIGGIPYNPCAPIHPCGPVMPEMGMVHPYPPMMPMDMGMMDPYGPYMPPDMVAPFQFPMMPADMSMLCPPGFVPYVMPMEAPMSMPMHMTYPMQPMTYPMQQMPYPMPQSSPCGCGPAMGSLGTQGGPAMMSDNAAVMPAMVSQQMNAPYPGIMSDTGKPECGCDCHKHQPIHAYSQGYGPMHPFNYDYNQPSFLGSTDVEEVTHFREDVNSDQQEELKTESVPEGTEAQARLSNKLSSNKSPLPSAKRKQKRRSVVTDYSSGPWLNV